MKHHTFTLELDVAGPLLTRSMDAARLGLDAHSLTDSDKPTLPGSHVRGHLRQALVGFQALLRMHQPQRTQECEELERLCELLGRGPTKSTSAGDTGDDNEPEHDGITPYRARLRFPRHFVGSAQGSRRQLHRIRIDTGVGRVDRGALLVMESALAPDERMTFCGELRLDDGELAPERIAHWLQRAASLIPALGSNKAVGFGRVLAARIAHTTREFESVKLPGDRASSRHGLRFNLDRPFCFASTRSRSDNRFESLAYVPGAAVLGALLEYTHRHATSDASGHCDTINRHSENIRFGHAHPVRCNAVVSDIPGPMMQSWVLAKNTLYELADSTPGVPIADIAPAFPTDWKHDAADAVATWNASRYHTGNADDACAWPERVLNVRTAIDPDRNSADIGKLFATECIAPDGFDWCLDFAIDDGVDRQQLLGALAHVLPRALHGLGKTKAEASNVRIVPAFAPRHEFATAKGDRLLLSLHSDAAIPLAIDGLANAGSAQAMHDAYRSAFAALSGNRLRLLRHFAGQRYAGGDYLYHRFWRKARPDYAPMLLTEAGSVFVFQVDDSDGLNALLDDWLARGLPVGDALADSRFAAWELNPYRRQNGYGEIRIRHVAANKAQGNEVLIDDITEWKS